MIKKFTLISTFLIGISTLGISQQAQWAKFMGGIHGGKGVDVETDSHGNVYSIGSYSYNVLTQSGPVDFDPGPGVFGFTPTTNGATSYISKLNAQGNFVWARSFTLNGAGSAELQALILDEQENLIVAGIFSGVVDFNLGPGVFNLTSGPEVGDSSVANFFLASYSSAGNFQWVKTFPCQALTIVPGYPIYNTVGGLTIDQSHNILLTLNFRGKVDLDPGSNAVWKECYGLNYNAAIVKLNNQGNFIWGQHFEGGFNTAGAVVCDPQNNVYVQGGFSQSVDFDPGLAENWIANYSFGDSYILKMSPLGEVLWMNKIHGTYGGYGGCSSITLDNVGNILATGTIVRDSLYFSSAFDSLFLLKSNSYVDSGGNSFVAKLDFNGHFLWIKQQASNSLYGVGGNEIRCDSANNIYVSGILSDSADFDYSGNGAISLATGDYSSFLLKLDADGNFIRTNIIDGDKYVACKNFTLDQHANIYLTGFFYVVNFDMNFPWGVMIGTGMIDFDPGLDTLPLIGFGNGPETIFVAKWNQCSAGTTTLNETACTSFSWNNETYTQSGTYPKSLTTALGCDSIARLNLTVLNNSQASQNIQICSGETYIISNQILNQSGVYETILTASTGCDSLVTTNLTVDTLNAAIALNDNVFTALNIPQNAQFQWLNCDNNFEIISGEVNPNFIAFSDGNYALESTLGNCRDTSNCILFSSVGLHSITSNQFKVFPIPADETLMIESEFSNSPIRIFDAQGRLIFETIKNEKRMEIDLRLLQSGLYFIQSENTSKPFTIIRNR